MVTTADQNPYPQGVFTHSSWERWMINSRHNEYIKSYARHVISAVGKRFRSDDREDLGF